MTRLIAFEYTMNGRIAVMRRVICGMAIYGVAIGGFALPAQAREVIVQMKNSGTEGAMAFEPSFVKIEPGDSVRFKPTDPGHNAETIPQMLPAGAAPLRGELSREVVLRVTKPGLYGIKCTPHYAMGMVAVIQVGKVSAAEVAAAKALKLPPFASKRMAALLDRVR